MTPKQELLDEFIDGILAIEGGGKRLLRVVFEELTEKELRRGLRQIVDGTYEEELRAEEARIAEA